MRPTTLIYAALLLMRNVAPLPTCSGDTLRVNMYSSGSTHGSSNALPS